MGLTIRDREKYQVYDWELFETDEYGLRLIVAANDLLHAGDVEIMAAYLEKNRPIYLMGSDATLYYYPGPDEILDQYIPILAFLTWKNGYHQIMTGWNHFHNHEIPCPTFPEGWLWYKGIVGESYILIARSLKDGFNQACKGKDPYEVLCDFPRVIERALLNKNTEGKKTSCPQALGENTLRQNTSLL